MSTSVSSVVSHFPSAENGFTTTTSGSVSSGATTVGLNSVAGYTNGEIVVFVIDPSNASKQTFTGVIDTSGVQVTSVVWTAGTNVTHLSGATVVDYATATHISMITKGLLVQHTQAGAHSAVTATSVATTGDISSSAGKITTTAVDKLEDYGVPLSTYRANTMFDHVASGGVWTGDAYASTRNASMTAMVCYINGRRISISAVTARSFTASKDTYIDVLDNADGTGTLVYTEVANNAASPALAANSIRIGIIVTGASNIAASTSIGQGGFANTAPVISSQVLKGFDSLGNLIYPKGPTAGGIVIPKFSVYRNAAWTTSSAFPGTTATPYDVKIFDTDNNVDVTTNKGRFTAPVAGFYWFSAYGGASSLAGGNGYGMNFIKNGVAISGGPTYVQGSTGGFAASSTLSIMLQLVAGDYVEVNTYASGSAASAGANTNNFYGHLVSAS